MASKSNRSKVQPIRPRDLLKPASGPIHPFDQVHGTDTSGLVPARDLITGHPNDEHVTAYYAVAPSILRSLVEQWKEAASTHHITDYTFLDMGAGKGRATLLASEFPFREVIGVELNPAMAAIATANARRWRDAHESDSTAKAISPVRIVETDALEFTLPATPTVLFLFHPFEDPVLKQVLRRIESAFMGRAGDLDILYVNAEHGNLISRHPAFKLLWEGQIPMSQEDHSADLEAIAQQTEYGSTGDELCAIYRFVGRGNKD
jgi:SAM-dependent methyltransferase